MYTAKVNRSQSHNNQARTDMKFRTIDDMKRDYIVTDPYHNKHFEEAFEER